jgi:bifunctional DNA-binding transcriptional regulator/antitoxin component of YhaV-PrlF toxin-antitoxin module
MKNTKEILLEIQERKIKIENLQRQVNSLLEIDDKGQAVVPKENRERGAQIGKALSELRRLNEVDMERLEKIQEISSKYNISEDEIHQLSLSIPGLERQVNELQESLKEWQRIDPSFEKQVQSKNSPFYQKNQLLKQSRKALDNQIKARALIETITRKKP